MNYARSRSPTRPNPTAANTINQDRRNMSSEVEINHYEVNNEKVRANGGWITNEFLQELISQHENDKDARVVGSEVNAAVGVGDNYLSIMYQMSAEYVSGKTGRKENRRFLIKGLPSATILRTMIEEYGMFRKELYVYNVCLPAMKRIMEEYMPEDERFIAAQSYKCSLPDVLVLEDLKLSGYRMADRRKQLDYHHTAVTLRSLARFHALSMKLVKMKPEVIEQLSKDELYSEEKKSKLYVHIVKALKSWLKVMKEQESTAGFVPPMEKATKNILDKTVFVVNDRERCLLSVNHGDSWTNNFMYGYDDEGEVVHAKLVDFQISRYACPVLDLLYFLFSSPRPDMLLEKFEDLVKVYHDALISDMERLRIDESEFPTLQDIQREMTKRSITALASVITVTPIVVAKPSDTADFENVDIEGLEKSEDYLLEKNFRDTYYQELVVKYMAIFEKMGYLKSAEELLQS